MAQAEARHKVRDVSNTAHRQWIGPLRMVAGIVLAAGFLVCASAIPAPTAEAATGDISRMIPPPDPARVEQLQETLEAQIAELRPARYYELRESEGPGWDNLLKRRDLVFMYLGTDGLPIFYGNHNLNAAKTVNTDDVWSGGGAGLHLDGSGMGRMGVFEIGHVLQTHTELYGRVIQHEPSGVMADHATHVAGTMIAAGVDPTAIGMSHGGSLLAFDISEVTEPPCDDACKMALAGSWGYVVSNHSYGETLGWEYDYTTGEWYWMGVGSALEDFRFGWYDGSAATWDQIAYTYPYYTIVKSAGNARDDTGPAEGEGHWDWDDCNDEWVWNDGDHTHNPDGPYDCIGPTGIAKNIITVGAVDDITTGYGSPADVVMTDFSSWGPPDDGRVKPDLVANGVDLWSSIATDDETYDYKSGTSMAAPSVAGSINLLLEHYINTHGCTITAAGIKAVVIQTANEAGPADGPDYMFGWGLLDTEGAAAQISMDTPGHDVIIEDSIDDGTIDGWSFSHGGGPFKATLAWTDPPGLPDLSLRDLVNDLDLSLVEMDTFDLYQPWVLNPVYPELPATNGINRVDNVEQIFVSNLDAGNYVVFVEPSGGALNAPPQDYALAVSAAVAATIDLPSGFHGEELPGPQTEYLRVSDIMLGSSGLFGTGEVEVEDVVRGIYWEKITDQWHHGFLREISGGSRGRACILETDGRVLVAGAVNDSAAIERPALWARRGQGAWDLTLLPGLSEGGAGEARDVHEAAGEIWVAGASENSEGISKATVWSMEYDSAWVANSLGDLSPWQPAFVNAIRRFGPLLVAGGSVTGDQGEMIPAVWQKEDQGQWYLILMPVLAGGQNGEVRSITDPKGPQDVPTFVGWSDDQYGMSRGIVWSAAYEIVYVLGPAAGYAQSVSNLTYVGRVEHIAGGYSQTPGEGRTATLWLPGDGNTMVPLDVNALIDMPVEMKTITAGARIGRVGWNIVWAGAAPDDSPTWPSGVIGCVLISTAAPSSTPDADTSMGQAGDGRVIITSPNPFSRMTAIRYDLPAAGRLFLSVHDVTGRRIARLADGSYPAGPHVWTWKGRDAAGLSVPAGVYYIRLQSPSATATEKVLRVR